MPAFVQLIFAFGLVREDARRAGAVTSRELSRRSSQSSRMSALVVSASPVCTVPPYRGRTWVSLGVLNERTLIQSSTPLSNQMTEDYRFCCLVENDRSLFNVSISPTEFIFDLQELIHQVRHLQCDPMYITLVKVRHDRIYSTINH